MPDTAGKAEPEGADQNTGRYSGRLFSGRFYDGAKGQSDTASGKRVVSEADRLADTVFGLRFDQPYKWEYINYIDERRFTPMAELTEESMQKPFLTYEQFVAKKERLRESVADDVMQGVDITEIQEPDREDNIFRTEIPDNDIGQAEVLDDTIVQTEQPVFSTFAITVLESETEVPDTLEQREPVSQTRDSMKNTESGLESPAEKTVTKQDYQRMTDKEKAE